MFENAIKLDALYSLEIGVIQTFQLEEYLQLKVLPGYEVKRMAKEILSEYNAKKNLA